MDTSRYRSKIGAVLCVFFICWCVMIHNVKWYDLSSPLTAFRHQGNPVEIVDTNITNPAATGSEDSSTGDDDRSDDKTNYESDNSEIDWLKNTTQMQALEKELEPVLEKLKPKPEEKKRNKTMIDKAAEQMEEKRKPKSDDRRVNETTVEKVAEQMERQRRRHRAMKRSCSGRYIYVHDLPARFNDDILDDCRSFNKWQDMCPFLDNNGLGPALGNPQRVLSRSGWYSTNQFLLEVIFQNRMKQYECLTNDSSIASAIYVPYYAGLDVSRYLFDHNTTFRDALSLNLAEWLREQPEWKTNSGRNHFLVIGRITWDFRRDTDDDDAWGSKLMSLPEFKNMTILTIEKSPWHSNDFGVPYPTYFHPGKDRDIVEWQAKMRRQKRRALFSFAGGPRPGMEDSIRGKIIEQCIASIPKCRLLQCSYYNSKCYQPIDVMRLFENSIFCLQPPGDSYTRRSTFDSILAGCIPVFFHPGSAYIQYLWHLPRDFQKYSVFINEEDVHHNNVSIEKVLSEIPAVKVSKMRDEVIRLIPQVVYADPKSKLENFKDAFDLSVDGVLERMDLLNKSASSFDFEEKSSWKYFLFGSVERHEWDHYFRYSRNQKVKKSETEDT
ncbi:hypothetical protein L2E82_00706 [Cichorium intybus]|uniref:Uncharacterized protein n=1 Tax=Cichorium intybus TaxID=13427 RepID=A0ACB9GY06_CICIN|nr:hypothetical protein L2E82_00706 [Cichorium intybus]